MLRVQEEEEEEEEFYKLQTASECEVAWSVASKGQVWIP